MKRRATHRPALGACAGSADADRAPRPCRPAGEVLGAEHPLSRTASALHAVKRHMLTVGALLSGGAAGSAAGATWAEPLTAAAGAVLVTLAAAARVLAANQGEHARALIERGDENLQIPAVHRQRERLLDDDGRGDLAGLLDHLARQGMRSSPPGPVRPLYDPRMIAATAADLREVAELLRNPPRSARGVAAAQRLVTDGASPLYGNDVRALRMELRRIRFLLHG
jgi:hypothetical protein